MRFFKILFVASGLLFLTILVSNGVAQVTEKTGEFKITDSCKYLLYLPDGYGDKNKKWPLVMYLHGAGERGDNLDLVKCNGLPQMVEQTKKFKFIIVAPQCPQKQWWPAKIETLMGLLDEIESKYDVDKDKVYVTGLSMGGFGSWSLASYYPDRFAAIAPICGGGDKLFVRSMKDVPVWAFHGAKDDIVPVERSIEMVNALNAVGGNAKLTIYPDAKHDSWTRTYKNPALYEWLLSHSISDRNK